MVLFYKRLELSKKFVLTMAFNNHHRDAYDSHHDRNCDDARKWGMLCR